MSWHKKFLFLSSIIVLVSTAAFGQAARSPFSAFAMGEPFGNALIQNQGMAGTGVSQPMFWSINNQNPALLVYNYYTAFQAGALVESRTFRNDTASQQSINGNLSYLAVAFPVMRSKKRPELMRWSTAVSLMPFSKSNYKLGYIEYGLSNNPNVIDTLGVIEQGSGGLSQFTWSNGVRLSPEIAVGLKASYVFGSTITDYSNTLLNTDQTIPYVVGIRDQIYVRDFMFTGGFSYVKDSVFRDDMRVAFGATYSFPADMRTSRNTVMQRRNTSGTPMSSDTLSFDRGSVNMPSSFTAGFSISKGVKWSLGTEFSMQDWSKFESINQEYVVLEQAYSVSLQNSWKISLGGELTPDQGALNSYIKRVTYRVGLSYEQTPYAVNGKQVNDLGINFGFSLPAGRSSLDWAFRVGKRGSISDTAVEESYFKIFFGITFNDQWFYQRKID